VDRYVSIWKGKWHSNRHFFFLFFLHRLAFIILSFFFTTVADYVSNLHPGSALTRMRQDGASFFLFFIQSLVIHEATYGYARHCECSLQLINHFLYVIINIICACLYSWVIPWDRECHQVKIGRIWSLNMIYTCMFTSFKISYQQTTYKQSCLTNISH
jgi:hypothetical protein